MKHQMVPVSLKNKFDLDVSDKALATGFAPWPESSIQARMVPEEKYWFFDKTTLKRALIALDLRLPFLLFGPTGCGKTEFLEQLAARLNWPFVLLNHHLDSYFQDYIAEKMLLGGDTESEAGPLVMAALYDAIAVSDEFNMSTASTNAGFHTIMANGQVSITPELAASLAGNPLVKGNVLHVSEGFRYCLTGNGGFSADAMTYKGTQPQNGAFRDRPIVHRMRYLPEDNEIKMLMGKFDVLAQNHGDMIARSVRLANDLRASHESNEFSLPVSSRTLITMLSIFQRWGGSSTEEVQQALGQAMDMTVRGKLEEEDVPVFTEAFHNHFGTEWAGLGL